MFQSTVSGSPSPSPRQNHSTNNHSTGNTHEFFAPVSVPIRTKDGYAYIAVGNDIQWERMLKINGFESLEKPEYARNEGRIKDVDNLNRVLESTTMKYSTNELISPLPMQPPHLESEHHSGGYRRPLCKRRDSVIN
jgi:formyl-CoA transferase